MKFNLTDWQLAAVQEKRDEIAAWARETPSACLPHLRVVTTANFKTEHTKTATIMSVLMPTVSAEFPDETSATLFKLRWL